MTTKRSVNDFVFVDPSRGNYPGMARVTRVSGNEAEIVFDDGTTEWFYFAHLYSNAKTIVRKKDFLEKRAAKVGR